MSARYNESIERAEDAIESAQATAKKEAQTLRESAKDLEEWRACRDDHGSSECLKLESLIVSLEEAADCLNEAINELDSAGNY